jgi:hypothetical protein
MKRERIKQLFPNASQSTIDVNADPRLQDTELERALCDGALATGEGKGESAGRVILSYTSYRQRLLDPDNLAGGTKFLTDALRYCGALRDDTENQVELRFTQKKVSDKTQEKTLIEVIYGTRGEC